jgi:hypothetical protein
MSAVRVGATRVGNWQRRIYAMAGLCLAGLVLAGCVLPAGGGGYPISGPGYYEPFGGGYGGWGAGYGVAPFRPGYTGRGFARGGPAHAFRAPPAGRGMPSIPGARAGFAAPRAPAGGAHGGGGHGGGGHGGGGGRR